MNKIQKAIGMLSLGVLVTAMAACGPSGDPHSPNPLDLDAALPCQANPLDDATMTIEVIDREGRLPANPLPSAIVIRDSVSDGPGVDVGKTSSGKYRVLPDERVEYMPYCWHIILQPKTKEAIVHLKGIFLSPPNWRLACYEIDPSTNMRIEGTYAEQRATSVSGNLAVSCTATVTKRAK